jgi:hypothetical protein
MSDGHVVRDGDQWALEVGGQERDGFRTQSEAITRSGQLGARKAVSLSFTAKGARFAQKNSHGNRPRDGSSRPRFDGCGPGHSISHSHWGPARTTAALDGPPEVRPGGPMQPRSHTKIRLGFVQRAMRSHTDRRGMQR